MIKKTLYFGNLCYLNCKNLQIIIKKKSELTGEEKTNSVPIEDIGVIIIDHYGVTLSQYLLSTLINNNVAVVICNENHMPNSMLLNLDGSTIQSERFKEQINASKPLLKNLWKQTVSAKIYNQAMLLNKNKLNVKNMLSWSKNVKSNDSSYMESRASVYYWKNLFPKEIEFTRDRYGEPPNNLLNYGYAILRAVVARGLVASGLLPTLGIHHRDKYNAYCLADDIMEPYRPFVDELVLRIINKIPDYSDLTTEIKKDLLTIPTLDVYFDNERKPLMIGMQRTTASLAKCFKSDLRNISYPELI